MKQYKTDWEIIKEIAVLRTGQNGWTKELNYISWNGQKPKFDVRWWSPDKKYVGKGLTLTQDEIDLLEKVIATLPQQLEV